MANNAILFSKYINARLFLDKNPYSSRANSVFQRQDNKKTLKSWKRLEKKALFFHKMLKLMFNPYSTIIGESTKFRKLRRYSEGVCPVTNLNCLLKLDRLLNPLSKQTLLIL